MLSHQIQATVRQAKAGSTKAFLTLFDAARTANKDAQRALLKLVLHHQFSTSRSDEALRVARGVDPSHYPTPTMHTMFLSLDCLATELHQNPNILRDITKRSIWDCIQAWMQFFLQHVVEAEPGTEDAWSFQDNLIPVLAAFVFGTADCANTSNGAYTSDMRMFILRTAARLWLFAARTADTLLIYKLSSSICAQTDVGSSPDPSAIKIVIDIFSDPPSAALIIKTLYRLPVSGKMEFPVAPIFSVLRLVLLLVRHTEDVRAFDSLCDMALFPCLIFVLRHLFPVGGRRRRTPNSPILSEQCATMILGIIHHTMQQRAAYILHFLKPVDVLAVLLMFAHRLQTVPPSDEYLSRNWERLLLNILTNLMVSSNFYYSVGSTTRKLIGGAKTRKAGLVVAQAGGVIWDKFVALKMVMESTQTRLNEFRNARWPLCCSEVVSYFLSCDFIGLPALFQCAMAKETQPVKACKLCAGCMKEYYCSRECQKADWKARHKEQCKSVYFKQPFAH
jgi:hypothetical protein